MSKDEKPEKITVRDFPGQLEKLAVMIIDRALTLKAPQFDLQLDAMKVCTAYYAAKNRATGEDEDGAEIAAMRTELLNHPQDLTDDIVDEPHMNGAANGSAPAE